MAVTADFNVRPGLSAGGNGYNPPMSRRWILPAVLLVLFFTASLISVEPGTLGVLQGAAGGRAFVLDPGLHFRIPFLQRLQVYPIAPFKIDFPWNVVDREGG